jgi:hypothetical protein
MQNTTTSRAQKLRLIVNHDLFSQTLGFILTIAFVCYFGAGTEWMAELIAHGLTLLLRFMLKQ